MYGCMAQKNAKSRELSSPSRFQKSLVANILSQSGVKSIGMGYHGGEKGLPLLGILML